MHLPIVSRCEKTQDTNHRRMTAQRKTRSVLRTQSRREKLCRMRHRHSDTMDNVNLLKEKRKGAGWLSNRLRTVEKKLDKVCTLLESTSGSQDRLLTREQAAERLSISTRTLDTLEADGEIRAVRIRGRVLYDPEALDAFIRACARK